MYVCMYIIYVYMSDNTVVYMCIGIDSRTDELIQYIYVYSYVCVYIHVYMI